MNLIEFIGFVISLIAMGFIIIKRFMEQRHRLQHPEQFEESDEEKQKALKEYFHSLGVEIDDNEHFSPPQKIPSKKHPQPPLLKPAPSPQIPKKNEQKNFQFKSNIESYRPESKIEKRKFKTSVERENFGSFEDRLLSPEFRGGEDPYKIVQKVTQPRIEKLVKELPSLKQMIIIREIIGPPKGMQDL